jgi:hypothetical protein
MLATTLACSGVLFSLYVEETRTISADLQEKVRDYHPLFKDIPPRSNFSRTSTLDSRGNRG